MSTYVAMLRGINVSGRNRLAMEDLRRLVTDAGGTDVRTYIQSGNAVFKSGTSAGAIVTALEGALARALGTKVPVLVRSEKELESVLRKNPYIGRGEDEARLHVTFMGSAPKAADVKSARSVDAGADDFVVVGRQVYLLCPGGYGKTKLTNAFFEKRFGSEATTRNWKTVARLVEMAQD
jgi:uncharacterized protein (DUF1697 family)